MAGLIGLVVLVALADPLALAARAVRRWFNEGNVPVNVGMLVLFARAAALRPVLGLGAQVVAGFAFSVLRKAPSAPA